MASPARRRRTPPLTAAAWATALALMHGGPARAAAACPGPGPATSYEHFVLARPLPDAERAVAQAVRVWGQQRGRALRYDERLGRAAAAVLPDVLGQVGAPLPMAALTAAARAEGLTDGELAAVAISAPAHRLARSVALELAAGALAGCEASHLG